MFFILAYAVSLYNLALADSLDICRGNIIITYDFGTSPAPFNTVSLYLGARRLMFI